MEVAEDTVVRIARGADGDTAYVLVVAVVDALEVSARGAIVVEVALIGAALEDEVDILLEVLALVAVLLGTFVAVYLIDQLGELVCIRDGVRTLLGTCAVPERIGGTDRDIIARHYKDGAGPEEGAPITGLLDFVRDVIFRAAVAQGNRVFGIVVGLISESHGRDRVDADACFGLRDLCDAPGAILIFACCITGAHADICHHICRGAVVHAAVMIVVAD